MRAPRRGPVARRAPTRGAPPPPPRALELRPLVGPQRDLPERLANPLTAVRRDRDRRARHLEAADGRRRRRAVRHGGRAAASGEHGREERREGRNRENTALQGRVHGGLGEKDERNGGHCPRGNSRARASRPLRRVQDEHLVRSHLAPRAADARLRPAQGVAPPHRQADALARNAGEPQRLERNRDLEDPLLVVVVRPVRRAIELVRDVGVAVPRPLRGGQRAARADAVGRTPSGLKSKNRSVVASVNTR